MKNPPWIIVGVLGSALLFTGCGKKSSDNASGETSEHAEGEEGGETGVTYKEGRGLQLVPEVIKALDLRTVEADEREVTAELEVTAQVFATKPKVLASASLPADRAELLRDASFEGASLVRIDTSTTTATRLADAVFALESAPSRQIGDFVQIAIRGKPTKVLTVPRSAILDAAAGNFVYVVNGNAYLRTPVKVGARSGELVEITDGVYAGDVVVASPIEQLWLAELRLTKGGGHAH